MVAVYKNKGRKTMKKLGVSLVAVLVGLPMMAQAAVQSPADVTVDTTKHVAATSFVQGAYNALAGVARDHATQIDANTAAIAGKQDQLTNGTNNVGATVGTSVRATGTADDITLVTEKAVRDAIDNAGGQTAQQVEDAIDAAAGAGIATDGNGKLSVDLTSNGGLELTGSGDAATVGVKVDGTHVIKDASGNVTLSQTDIDNLTAASTALQSNSALNGANLTAGTVAKTALAQGVQDSLDAADNAANKDLGNLSSAGTAVITSAVTSGAAGGTYINTTSGLTATTIQGAIDEVAAAASGATNKQVEVYTTWDTTTTGKANALVNPD